MYFWILPGKEKMSLSRFRAILLEELYVTRHSLEVIMDIVFFPVMNVLVFGFIAQFLIGSTKSNAGNALLAGMILWQIVYIVQYSMSVSSLWNIWSRNLSNIFITPISLKEYLGAHMLSGLLKAIISFIFFGLISIYIFNFNIFNLGIINLTLFFINLTLFSWSTGIIILGVIFRFGTRIQALAWGLIFLFQPLTAALFPVRILPHILQLLAYLLPPTFVFEAARNSLAKPGVNWEMFFIAVIENIVYFMLTIAFFNYMFKKAKDTGQFARNEG